MSTLKPKNSTLAGAWFPLTIFGLWLMSLLSLLYLGTAFTDHRLAPTEILNKWDSGWYQSIAANGYHYVAGAQSNVAFFPLYPLLVRGVHLMGLAVPYAGAVVSLACFAATLVMTYLLTRERFNEPVARLACLLLAFFPFSFFFSQVYTESLFALLTVLTLWLAQRQRWLLAAIATALAGSTRLIGLFLAVVVVGGYLSQHRKELSQVKVLGSAIGLLAVCSLGFIAFATYLQMTFGNARVFMEAQRFWPGRAGGLSGLKEIARHLMDFHVLSNPYALNLTELVCIVIFGALTLYCWLRVSKLWALFCALALVVPLATGTTISMNRYVIVLVPCFIAAALWLKTLDRAVFVLIPSAILLTFYFSLFYSTPVFLG